MICRHFADARRQQQSALIEFINMHILSALFMPTPLPMISPPLANAFHTPLLLIFRRR